MGSCFSKKKKASVASPPTSLISPAPKSKLYLPLPAQEDESKVKKEIFVIKHRKSHSRSNEDIKDEKSNNENNENRSAVDDKCENQTEEDKRCTSSTAVRTSSCNKEEVEAILIQCGRLSRSSSSSGGKRKYSGSKRSYDFDNNNCDNLGVFAATTTTTTTTSEDTKIDNSDDFSQGRQRHGQSPRSRSRASPSPQGRRRRTPSRERNQQERSSSRERRTSQSPGRRRLSMEQNNNNTSATNNAVNSDSNRPGKMKMVSVPATVSSLVMDKSNNNESASNIKRISVKRNAGSQSPARAKPSNESASLSRSGSRKTDQSPYRRQPLNEVDPNLANQLKSNVEISSNRVVAQPQTLTRSRSSRRSRDLDINPETLTNPPPPSYTRLLLQDIHNFHQQSTSANTAPVAVSLPRCVTKASSILEAVADLNSTTTSAHLTSNAFSADRNSDRLNSNSSGGKDSIPFVESEIHVDDDLMQPSFHKYVTVKRGGEDIMEDQESSGSNSFVSGARQPNHWGMSSAYSWEPNSADSTDSWTSRNNAREDSRSFDVDEAARKRLSGRNNTGGIGRGKPAGPTKGGFLHPIPVVATAAASS